MNAKKNSSNIHPIWNWINWLSFPLLLSVALHLVQAKDSVPQSTFSVPLQSLEQPNPSSNYS